MPTKILTDVDGKPLDNPEATPPSKSLYDIAGKLLSLPPKTDTPHAGNFGAPSQIVKGLPDALPAIGGALGSMGGPVSGVAGAGLGSAIGNGLQNEFPSVFGEGPKSGTEAFSNILGDTAIQGAVPAVAGKVAGAVAGQGIKQFAKNKSIQLMASKIGQKFPAVKSATEATQFGNALNEFNDHLTGQIEQFSKGMAGKGVTEAEKLIQKAGGAGKNFDPDILTKAIKEDPMNLHPATKQAMTDFADHIRELKSTAPEPGKDPSNTLINYAKNKLTLAVPLAVSGVLTGHGIGTTAVGGGLVITNSILGRLMTNPETAQLVVRALKTPVSAPESKVIGTVLSNAIRATMAAPQIQSNSQKEP